MIDSGIRPYPAAQQDDRYAGQNEERIMRIAIMGQAAFGAKVLETLSDKGEAIIGAWLPQGKPASRPDPLKTAAENRGIPTHQPQSYKAPETLAAFRDAHTDLLIMAFVTDNLTPQQSGERRRDDAETVKMILSLIHSLAPKFQKDLMKS